MKIPKDKFLKNQNLSIFELSSLSYNATKIAKVSRSLPTNQSPFLIIMTPNQRLKMYTPPQNSGLPNIHP